MSLNDYKESQEISALDFSFYAIIMAAIRKADGDNALILQRAYPKIWNELIHRYNAPGGFIEGDK